MYGDKLEHEFLEYHEALYLRLELLSPNRFDKLVRFVFGDIIRTRIDRMKRKPCCPLII